MSLFIKQNIVLHSGGKSDFKIICDTLSEEDLNTIAYLISKKFQFGQVIGIPTGGIKIAEALLSYVSSDNDTVLIVDDVLTTGNSFLEYKNKIKSNKIIGVVLFARGDCPEWIFPIFSMSKKFR